MATDLIEQVSGFPRSVSVMGILHPGPLPEEGIGLIEEQDGPRGPGTCQLAPQVLLGFPDVVARQQVHALKRLPERGRQLVGRPFHLKRRSAGQRNQGGTGRRRLVPDALEKATEVRVLVPNRDRLIFG